MKISTAKRAINADRILVLAFIQLMQHKGILNSDSDIAVLRGYCRAMIETFGAATDDGVVGVQLAETRAEIEHIFPLVQGPIRNSMRVYFCRQWWNLKIPVEPAALTTPLICQTGPKTSANSGCSCSMREKRCISGRSLASGIIGIRS